MPFGKHRRYRLSVVGGTPLTALICSFRANTPFPIGRAPRHRLDLAPVVSVTGAVRRIATIAHDSLEAVGCKLAKAPGQSPNRWVHHATVLGSAT
jgi:hypothetical protein